MTDINTQKIYENWLIESNKELTNENKELLKKNQTLMSEIEEKERELDTFDISKRYTKGLLKNLVQLEVFQKTLKEMSENTLNDYKEQQRILIDEISFLSKFYMSIMTLLLLLYFIFFEFSNQFLFYIFLSSFSFGCNETIVKMMKINVYDEHKNKRLEIMEEIKKIQDSQNFLYEYIDNL